MITILQRSMKIRELVAKLNKKYGENTIGLASEIKYSDVPRLPSGSLFLDWALGINHKDSTSGWPLGRIVELYGPESSGKSLISMKTIVQVQKLGYDCVYLDCENTFDKTFAQTLGVDTEKLVISRESQGEKLLDLVCEMLKEDSKIKVVVFDSLAAMIPTVEIEDSLEQVQMAPMARLMSKGLRKLTASNKANALIIFINQLRVSPGVIHGNPEYTPGGRSLKFYASLRLEIRRGDFIFDLEDKKKKLGQIVKFKVVKNKSDIPYREGYFKFLYTGEIDSIDELVSIGLLIGVITRKGAYYNVSSYSWQGRESMETELKNNDKVFNEVKKLIFEGGD